MDVVSSNMREQIALMIESIREADFVTFDAEFSGLSVGTKDQ